MPNRYTNALSGFIQIDGIELPSIFVWFPPERWSLDG